MKKIFVLDTNVLIHDPEATIHFEDNDVILPITVIEELDNLKKGNGEIPFSARKALRLIDSFREKGNLAKGVKLPEDGTLRVVVNETNKLLRPSNDNKIISAAVTIAENSGDMTPVILVSKDTSVRIKAETLGLNTQDYLRDKTTVFQLYGKVQEGDKTSEDITSVRYLHSGDQIFRAYGTDKMELIRRQRSVMNISPKNIEQ